jgi:hypothetical protein
MKVALCLSGQPRFVNQCVPTVQEHILDGNDVDVFYHTWFDASEVGKSYGTSIPYQSGKVGNVLPDTLEILSTLKPLKSLAEPQKYFDFTDRLKGSPTAVPHHIASMFYSIMRCAQIREEYTVESGVKYDLIIRARMDLYYGSKVDLNGLFEIASQGKLASPYRWQNERMGMIAGLGNYTMNADFAASNTETMKIFTDVFYRMEEINTKIYPPFTENYAGYRTRVMGGIEVVPFHLDIDIMQRKI